MNIFWGPSRSQAKWTLVGLASSFPNTAEDIGSLVDERPFDDERKPGCKIFQIPKDEGSASSEVTIEPGKFDSDPVGDELSNQVLVFRYRDRFHAVDHRCPHAAYPLCNGMPFDIEDFGVVLSAGLTCPKHAWSFDLFTGLSDRSSYKLAVWEVQLRDDKGEKVLENKASAAHDGDRTVWVRRKQRIG